MHPRVYLAGPISGMEYEGAVEWRNWAMEWLRAVGIRAYSPMRAKEFLAAEEQHGRLPTFLAHDHPLATSKGIMCRDHTDCVRADALHEAIDFRVDTLSEGVALIQTILLPEGT